MLLNSGVGEDSWESLGLQGDPTTPSLRRSVLKFPWKAWCWSWNSNTLATWCEEPTYLKRPWKWSFEIFSIFWDWKWEEKGATEDEMVGWHQRLNGHGFGWTSGVGDGQGGLVCCSSWGRKESDMTEWLNWTECWIMTKIIFSQTNTSLNAFNTHTHAHTHTNACHILALESYLISSIPRHERT